MVEGRPYEHIDLVRPPFIHSEQLSRSDARITTASKLHRDTHVPLARYTNNAAL